MEEVAPVVAAAAVLALAERAFAAAAGFEVVTVAVEGAFAVVIVAGEDFGAGPQEHKAGKSFWVSSLQVVIACADYSSGSVLQRFRRQSTRQHR